MLAGKDANWAAIELSSPQGGVEQVAGRIGSEPVGRGAGRDSMRFPRGSLSERPTRKGEMAVKAAAEREGVPRRAARTTGTAFHESGNAGVQQGSPEQPRQRCSTLWFARAERFGFQIGQVRKDQAKLDQETVRTLSRHGNGWRTAEPASVRLEVDW